MRAEVRLTITRGMPEGKVFVFRDRAIGSLGRADDCLLRLPSTLAHMDISRHHCLLDIEPPTVRVRDLGSKNGTFINEEKIGQRKQGLPPEGVPVVDMTERTLADGDEVRVGSTVFRVAIAGDGPAARTPDQMTVPGGVLVN
jgi:pSer/pThr/pTyr-binding forkhead associated (FHA) protein